MKRIALFALLTAAMAQAPETTILQADNVRIEATGVSVDVKRLEDGSWLVVVGPRR